MTDRLTRETPAAQVLSEVDPASGALSPAIQLSTTYATTARTRQDSRRQPIRLPRAVDPRTRVARQDRRASCGSI